VSSIDAQRVLRTVKAIEKTGTVETAHRCLQSIGQALRWGVQHGRAARDFTPDLRGALGSTGTRHHARVTLNELPTLLQSLKAAANYPTTALAIDWLFFTACRTGEMRCATWQEIVAPTTQRAPERAKLLQWKANELDRMCDGVTAIQFIKRA
jgi:integrase